MQLNALTVAHSSAPARASAALFGAAACFQVALAAGAPWGAAAWGGAFAGTLPPGMRAASAASACVLAGLATGVAGAVFKGRARRRFLTGALVYSSVAVVMNAATPSAVERSIWVPYALIQVTLLSVALRRERPSIEA